MTEMQGNGEKKPKNPSVISKVTAATLLQARLVCEDEGGLTALITVLHVMTDRVGDHFQFSIQRRSINASSSSHNLQRVRQADPYLFWYLANYLSVVLYLASKTNVIVNRKLRHGEITDLFAGAIDPNDCLR